MEDSNRGINKRTTKQLTMNKMAINSKSLPINNCFKCKWTTFSNQKTEWLNNFFIFYFFIFLNNFLKNETQKYAIILALCTYVEYVE